MKKLQQKIVLITGGGSGIGLACAALFAKKGWRVVIVGRNMEKLKKVALLSKNITHLGCDVTRLPDIKRALSRAKSFGDIILLVHAAGQYVENIPTTEVGLKQWKEIMLVNATGTFLINREFAKLIKSQACGIAINIISLAGLSAYVLSGRVAYSASKHAALAVICTLDQEMRRFGGRVMGICPGLVTDTPMVKNLLDNNIQLKKSGLTSSKLAREVHSIYSRKPYQTIYTITREKGLKPVLAFREFPIIE